MDSKYHLLMTLCASAIKVHCHNRTSIIFHHIVVIITIKTIWDKLLKFYHNRLSAPRLNTSASVSWRNINWRFITLSKIMERAKYPNIQVLSQKTTIWSLAFIVRNTFNCIIRSSKIVLGTGSALQGLQRDCRIPTSRQPLRVFNYAFWVSQIQ